MVHVSLIRNEIDFENEINSNRSFVESGVKFNNFKLSRNRSFTFVVLAIWSPSIILKIKSTTMQFIWYTVRWGPNFCPEKFWNDLNIAHEICLVNALLVQTVRIWTKSAHSNNLKIDQKCNLVRDHQFRKRIVYFPPKLMITCQTEDLVHFEIV